jgi:chromosome segregation ATPase
MPTVSKTDREIATIKADIASLGHMLGKLDNTLDKIGEASSVIAATIAVHEERLNTSEKDRMERRKESDAVVKELHSRITTASRETADSLKDHNEKILLAIEKLRGHIDKEQAHLEKRIDQLEKWKWVLLGALIAGSALFPNMGKLVSLLGSG